LFRSHELEHGELRKENQQHRDEDMNHERDHDAPLRRNRAPDDEFVLVAIIEVEMNQWRERRL
jgi:hypothetical protein